MGASRTTHRVRCQDKAGDLFVDVEVLDAVSVQTANGNEILYSVQASQANPYVFDPTGDGPTIGDLGNCSRVSHIKRIQNPNDNTQFIDVEVLDAFTLVGQNGQEFALVLAPDGPMLIVDNTGSGLGASPGNAGRSGHVAKISEISDGPKTDSKGVSIDTTNTDYPPVDTNTVKDQYSCIIRTDAISFDGPVAPSDDSDPNAVTDDDNDTPEFLLLFNSLTSDLIDSTNYMTDPTTGKQVPPMNSDPNPYVRFPPSSATPAQGGLFTATAPINQGPLWWIRNIGITATILTITLVDHKPSPPEFAPSAWGSEEAPMVWDDSEEAFFIFGDSTVFLGTISPTAVGLNLTYDVGKTTATLGTKWATKSSGTQTAAMVDPDYFTPGTEEFVGTSFDYGPGAGSEFASYSIVNLKYPLKASGGTYSETISIRLGAGDEDAHAFDLAIQTWNGTTVFEAAGSLGDGFVDGKGGKPVDEAFFSRGTPGPGAQVMLKLTVTAAGKITLQQVG